MRCNSCGRKLPKTAGFCPSCGASVASMAARKKAGLGGWVLVFGISLVAICMMLAVSAIGGLAASALFRSPIESLIGTQAADIVLWTCAYSLAVAISCFAIALTLFRRSPRTLGLTQALGIALIVIGAILLVLLNLSLMQQGANVIGRSILSLAGEIAALLLTTLFFCKSSRMRAYMGGTAYLRKALFRIGDTR